MRFRRSRCSCCPTAVTPASIAAAAAAAAVAFAYSLWAMAGAGAETVYWGFLLLMAGFRSTVVSSVLPNATIGVAIG